MAQNQPYHPSNCERATARKCSCTYCAGTQHGWVEALLLTRRGREEDLQKLERDVNRRWYDECRKQDSKREKHPKATYPHKKAAVDSVKTNVIRWLRDELPRWLHQSATEVSGDYARGDADAPHEKSPAEEATPQDDQEPTPEFDPHRKNALASATSEVQRIEVLGTMLRDAFDDAEKEIGELSKPARQAMADHFWCELITQLAVVINESNRVLDSVPDKVATAVATSRGATKIQYKIIVSCVRQLWKQITNSLGLTAVSDAKKLLPALRALAFLVCKAPDRHDAVLRHALDPLKAALLPETKQRLKRVLHEQLPEITAELDSTTPPPQRA